MTMSATASHARTGLSERIGQLLSVAHEAIEKRDLGSAERHALDALRLADEILGPDHAEMVVPYTVLSVIYIDSRKYPQAEFCARAAMEILINSSQGETILAARTQAALAVSLCMQRKMEGVVALFECAITSLRRHIGEHSLEMLMVLNSQAIAYSMAGYDIEAEKILLRLSRLLDDKTPIKGLSQCDVLINLALSVFNQGDIGRAIGYAKLALSKALCFHEKDYSKIATVHGLLFNINLSRNDAIAAETHGRKMLDIIAQHNARNVDTETIKDVRIFIAYIEFSGRAGLA